MLKPDPTTTNYILYLLVPGFASPRGCRGRELGGMVNIYNLLLYNAAATSVALLLYCFILNCSLILASCCKNRRKMLVFDRLSLFPLTLVILSYSPLYSLPFHFVTITYFLDACV